ncbi:MAG: molybdopterin molybdotransferase MoeA [Coriobacteriia bacterium]|nr:molybdopterin molybdotransferase MoeA [Coriobacteriia bacterium]
MISVEEAQAQVLARITRLAPQRIDALDALGCVLATDVVSDIDVAPFDNSAMDGYAVQAADTVGATDEAPVILRVVDHIAAGIMPARDVARGEASRIMTGAPVPVGADSIVMVEHTAGLENGGSTGGTVAIGRPATAGDHIRRRGEDVRIGDVVLRAGEVVGPAAAGLLAAVGAAFVEVYRRPVIAVVSTGDELVGVTDIPGPGQIRNSNSYSLAAQVLDAGGIPMMLGIARDTEAATRAVLERAPEFDLMVSTGGVSMGDFDVVKDVLEQIGEMDFWKVAMRPGAPQTYGTIGGTPFFGLPGNPTSTMVGFELFVRPAIRKMRGFTELARPRTHALLVEDIRKKSDRRYFMRGRIERAATASPGAPAYEVGLSGAQSSAMLTAMHHANCLISLPEGESSFAAGSVVECIRLDMEEGTP